MAPQGLSVSITDPRRASAARGVVVGMDDDGQTNGIKGSRQKLVALLYQTNPVTLSVCGVSDESSYFCLSALQ